MEFALVLPLLLVVALALLQLGLLVRDSLMVEAALAAGPGLEPGAVSVDIARVGARGEPVTVSVGYSSTDRVALVAWLFPDPVTMRSSVTARQEFG